MFADVSHCIRANTPALHYGVAVLDFDADGRWEFVVAGFGGPNRVLKWVNGSLRDVAPALVADPGRNAVGVAAGDIDGDGREELYLLNADTFAGPKSQPDRLFDALPDGTWADLFTRPENQFARNLLSGRSVAALDRRGTGRYGFLVASYGRPFRLYELVPGGGLADVADSARVILTTGGRGVWVGPFISDRTDIVCVNERGPNCLFVNDGNGTFTEQAAEYGLQDPEEHARGVAVLDADGDGRLDLAYGNWDGPHRLMVRRPDGTFRDRATPALALPSLVRNVLAADFDNDGFEELFFNNLGEPNRLFGCRRPSAPSREDRDPDSRTRDFDLVLLDAGAAAEPDGLGTGAAVADIDGDGLLELLIAHGESAPQPLSLYKVPETGHGWLRVAPRTRFGAPARGALVRLTAGGRVQTRVIDGGSGYLCQIEPIAHFGLGRLTTVDSISVLWPDGAAVVIDHPPIRTTLTIDYPEG